MKQCQRCLKHIAEVGVHTCQATEYARRIEAENAKLKQDMDETVQLLEKLGVANGQLGSLLTSTSGVLDSIAKALKGKGYD